MSAFVTKMELRELFPQWSFIKNCIHITCHGTGSSCGFGRLALPGLGVLQIKEGGVNVTFSYVFDPPPPTVLNTSVLTKS